MKETTSLEVALNGPWSRSRQPNIPVTADEIVEAAVACAGEGASVIHFHAYDPATGRQRDDYEIYAPIIERIRSRSDVICYGTLPFAGSVDAPNPLTPAQRFGAVDQLVRAGLIEWSVVDPGRPTSATTPTSPPARKASSTPTRKTTFATACGWRSSIASPLRMRSMSPASCAWARRCTAPTRARQCQSTG